MSHAISHLSRAVVVLAAIVAFLSCGVPMARAAAGQNVPRGRWEVQVVTRVNDGNLHGSIVYTFGVTLKAGGSGVTTASMEYQGSAINDGLLKGNSHMRAVISRPITNTTRDADKLLLYSGGTFKLASGTPPGHTIKEYATLGGLFPEATIDKLMESFYGVIVFTIKGDDLEFVPKDASGGKGTVWKKVR